jgi:hypothetical protein
MRALAGEESKGNLDARAVASRRMAAASQSDQRSRNRLLPADAKLVGSLWVGEDKTRRSHGIVARIYRPRVRCTGNVGTAPRFGGPSATFPRAASFTSRTGPARRSCSSGRPLSTSSGRPAPGPRSRRTPDFRSPSSGVSRLFDTPRAMGPTRATWRAELQSVWRIEATMTRGTPPVK